MKSIIVDPIKKTDSNSNVLLKQYYHECMNETKIDKEANKAFKKAIEELGGWPLLDGSSWNASNFNWVEWYIKSKELGLPVYGFFRFTRIETDANYTVLQVSAQPRLDLNKLDYNLAMKQVLEALGVKDFRKTENEEVFEFIKSVRGLLYPTEDIESVNTIENLIKECSFVPWLKILNSFAAHETEFNKSSEVAFSDIQTYCEQLSDLLDGTSSRTIANYYVWSIIHNMHKFMSRDVRKAYGVIIGKNNDRYSVCFKEADSRFRYLKETIYVRRKTPEVVKKQLTYMIDLMKETFIEHLKVCDWMDDITKTAAIEKTELIENVIGGDEELYDPEKFDEILGLDKFRFTSDNIFEMAREKRIKETRHFFKTLYGSRGENWGSFFRNAVNLDAYFVQHINLMILPAPMLSSILYDYRAPAFMNYGSIGRVIGHEIMHGFQKTSRKVILDNDKTIDWWTNATADAYDEKVKCLIEEYENLPFRYKLNGKLTLDENISDFVGIDVAYETYLKYIGIHGTEKKLPGLSLTPEQIFWIQTGTWLCFRKLDDKRIDFERENSVHAIPMFRVEGGAKHSKYFAKDFNCPVGSPMNPRKKCRIL
ncbi:hypothetical protein WA026_002072 [Henosepilachna vigintioctopunctata]|uniref:Neprilysin n=1 Tax=Henosepilachna vigintioctopunctata TaxID=420089 RepID=A0AAW1TQC4_9CUCU